MIEVLARLETKRQALILGHAVPMPIVIRTRDYRELYGELAGDSVASGTPGQPPIGRNSEAAKLLYGG
jgi:uncharacterized protein